jgi:predicted methyltransferase
VFDPVHDRDVATGVATAITAPSTRSRRGRGAAGFAELFRVLRPGGLLVLTVHRHVLGCAAEQLRTDATAAGFDDLELVERPRRWISPAVELTARRP